MSFDRRRDRHERYEAFRESEDWESRRGERDSWTDIAYLIVAAVALVLMARVWSRILQPWGAGLLGQLSVTKLVTVALVLLLVVAVAGRAWVTHRRRRASRGLRLVDLPRHIRATDPMASGERARRRAGSRVAEGHHAVTRSALDAARRRAHAAARVGGSLVRSSWTVAARYVGFVRGVRPGSVRVGDVAWRCRRWPRAAGHDRDSLSCWESTMTDMPERLDLHNCSIDEELAAKFHRCGQIHLQTGRRCVREMHHRESCEFVDAKEVVRIVSSDETR